MPKLIQTQLDMKRCPHCNVDMPTLSFCAQLDTIDYTKTNRRVWGFYRCNRCGGIVMAAALDWNRETIEIYPSGTDIDVVIPERARSYLDQAVNSLSSPAGAVMLAASAVDAMLKAKNLKEGSLFLRIDQAASENLITSDMATWAHQVRLDANDQRHSDDQMPLPDANDAKRCVDFALALAQFMFVLPARVNRGIAETQKK